jgi:hypothetical protein
MKTSILIVLLAVPFSPSLSEAQEIYRVSRSLADQQAISHIGQAEYYARMALRSLEASQKIGKAPYFNYQTAREDLEKVLAEFKTYLKGDESTDLPPALPLIIDGRYFAESIKDFLGTQKTDEGQTATKSNEARLATPKAANKKVEPERKKSVPEKEQRSLQQNSAMTLSPPALAPQSSKTKRDKIEEILKKGL